jgi:hypothetical protein
MTIFVQTLTGIKFELHVDAGDKIERVRTVLQQASDIPTTQQRLIFANQQLDDGKSLADYGIKADDVLHLVIRTGGGGKLALFTVLNRLNRLSSLGRR